MNYQKLILDLISANSSIRQRDIDLLSSEEWERFLVAVFEHRVSAILKWRLNNNYKHLRLPEKVNDHLSVWYKESTIKALKLIKTLKNLGFSLNSLAVPYRILKGGFLSIHCYPEYGLRPLRDIDILVPQNQVITVYKFLMMNGFRPIDPTKIILESYLEVSNHLPPLISNDNDCIVELHFRVFKPKELGIKNHEPAEDPHYWNRCSSIVIDDVYLNCDSPTDLLLHLVEHSVVHHKFDNGPLIITDIIFLLEKEVIDWVLFWDIAERYGLSKSATFLLKMVESYSGNINIEWSNAMLKDLPGLHDQISNASSLMLRKFEHKHNYFLSSEFNQNIPLLKRIMLFIRKLFPERALISLHYSVPIDKKIIYFYYLVRFKDLLINRIPQLISLSKNKEFKSDVVMLSSFTQWLES